MADSDDDFDEAWKEDGDKTASDPLKYIAKRINDLEALAVERLAAENITPADLQEINYQAVVGASVICRQDVFTNKLPAAVGLPAETWAACQAVKSEELNINQKSTVLQFLFQKERELRLNDYLPDIKLGKKLRQSMKKAHEKEYGTKREKEKKWKSYQDALDGCSREHPKWGITAMYSYVAEQFHVSAKTIWRRTTKPPKKT